MNLELNKTHNINCIDGMNLLDDNCIDLTVTSPPYDDLRSYKGCKWNFDIYSSKCAQKVDSLLVKIPRYNVYSEDPLCEGIDGEDFSLCDKYLEYEVSYDTFKRKVEEYKKAHEVKKVEPKKDEEQFSIKMIINKVLEFIINYQIYIIIILGVLLLILIIIIIVKKKKKRGVLE